MSAAITRRLVAVLLAATAMLAVSGLSASAVGGDLRTPLSGGCCLAK